MPVKPSNERYQIRGVPLDLQKEVAAAARTQGMSVATLVARALESYLQGTENLDIFSRLEEVARHLRLALARADTTAHVLEASIDKIVGRRPSTPKNPDLLNEKHDPS